LPKLAASLNRLWHSQDKTEEAQKLLSEVYDWFKERFDTIDSKQAMDTLEELS